MKTLRLTLWLALAALAGVCTGPAQAQEPEAVTEADADTRVRTRTLLIQNGQVYVDGKPAPLPSGLTLSSGVRQEFRFWGVEVPTVELNGQLFTLEGPQLKPYPLNGEAGQEVFSFNGAQWQGEQMYLQVLQEDNASLYRQLTREQNLEIETRNLAARIRLSTDEAQRSRLRDQLTQQLEAIFELKQQNRREEIAELDAQLEELKKRLQIRERMKNIMVETRAEALITGKVSLDQK